MKASRQKHPCLHSVWDGWLSQTHLVSLYAIQNILENMEWLYKEIRIRSLAHRMINTENRNIASPATEKIIVLKLICSQYGMYTFVISSTILKCSWSYRELLLQVIWKLLSLVLLPLIIFDNCPILRTKSQTTMD